VPEVAPAPGEIVVTKTTDSALTGTNLRLVLANMGIRNVVVGGIYTDQCVSSTVRSLADESFNVVLIEDCCAAGTDALHDHELQVLNRIYCHVLTSGELRALMGLG
jgi:biuret amidohydrolase